MLAPTNLGPTDDVLCCQCATTDREESNTVQWVVPQALRKEVLTSMREY